MGVIERLLEYTADFQYSTHHWMLNLPTKAKVHHIGGSYEKSLSSTPQENTSGQIPYKK